MVKTEMHPIGLWVSFFGAIRDYRDFLQDAVERGVDARSVEGKAFVRHEKAAELLSRCSQILEQECWLAPHDGNLIELEDYCKRQEYPVESLIQAAIWFQANRIRERLDELNITIDDMGYAERAIHYRLKLDESQKVIESYLYVISLDEWFQVLKNVDELSEPSDEPVAKQRKRRGAKQLVIEFVKERVIASSDYMKLSEMKQGKSFKDIKVKLWNEFQEKEPKVSKSITIETFHSYVTDALNELDPSRKQTSD